MGAIGGILICDYFIIRSKQLQLADLFRTDGAYTYSGGFNWRAVVALVLAIAPVLPGFLRAATTPGGQVADPGLLDTLYTYAWFVTFGIAFLVYLILTKAMPVSNKQ